MKDLRKSLKKVKDWALNNPEKVRAASILYRRKHPEVNRRATKKYRLSHPGFQSDQHLKSRYDITRLEYEILLAGQNGVCEICGRHPKGNRLQVDHDHLTGRIRGLLHRECNIALGLLQDSPEVFRRAAEYLERKYALSKWKVGKKR